MRLTTFTDYALRVLIHVASRPRGAPRSRKSHARFAISEHHLVKVVHRLGKAGFSRQYARARWRLRLALPAGEIGIGRVVRATEGPDSPGRVLRPFS
jgi:Rrf2 family nitric oxide-sensitive transcriptional repressor